MTYNFVAKMPLWNCHSISFTAWSADLLCANHSNLANFYMNIHTRIFFDSAQNHTELLAAKAPTFGTADKHTNHQSPSGWSSSPACVVIILGDTPCNSSIPLGGPCFLVKEQCHPASLAVGRWCGGAASPPNLLGRLTREATGMVAIT